MLKKTIQTASGISCDCHVITRMDVDFENKQALIYVSIFKDKTSYDAGESKLSGDWMYNWLEDDFPFTGAEGEDRNAIAYQKLKQVEPFFVDAQDY